MLDPFTAWSRMVAAGMDMQSTWLLGIETIQASGAVIGARSGKMRDAMGSPVQADLAEFARIVPEKVDALSRSGSAVTRDAMAMHDAWASQMQRVGLMMLSGKAPTLSEASLLVNQTAEYALGAMTAGAKLGKGALAPIHHTATGNARRLNKAKLKANRR
jgi:ABC-type taurine transport system substrate-binding protein